MKKYKKTDVFYVVLFAVVIILGLLLHFFFPLSKKTIVIGQEQFRVEIAGTPALREKGLSGRPSLSSHSGMLFLFSVPSRQGIWMKDMQFPIDILWLRDAVVVDMAPNISPTEKDIHGDFPIYLPRLPANRVIEVPAGTLERLDVKIGDVVRGL